MLSRSWLLWVLVGVTLLVVGGALGLTTVVRIVRQGRPPPALSVGEAITRVTPGAALEHVQLTDLVVQCALREVRDGVIVATGTGAEDGPSVLVALDPERPCPDGRSALVGRLSSADEFRGQLPPRVHGVFTGHADERGRALALLALALLGGASLPFGLRMRRAGRELVRQTLEDPSPQADADVHLDDPYRQPHDGRWLLPGPLRLEEAWVRRARRRYGLLAGTAVVAIVLITKFTVVFARDALRMHAVWEKGETAAIADVEVASLINLAIVDRSAVVAVYTDQHGDRHHGRVSRLAFGFPVYDFEPPVLRHLRDDPDRFAVSWFVDDFDDELLLHVALALTVGLFAIGALSLAAFRLRELARIRATIHNSPREVVLDVLSALGTTYNLRTPDGNTLVTALERGQRPLFLERDESKVLGLVRSDDPRSIVVLREDLAPLVADRREAERVRLRYRARGAPAPRRGPPAPAAS